MSFRSRRDVLTGVVGSVVVLAGCLEEDMLEASLDSSDGTDTDSSDGNGSGEDDPEEGSGEQHPDEGTGSDEESSGDPIVSDTVSFSHSDPPDRPDADVFRCETDATDWLVYHGLETNDDLLEFVEETDFEAERLVALEGTGSHGGYEMAIVALESDDGAVSIDARVVDGSSDDEATIQPMLAVGALVRVSFEGEPPSQFSISIVDGDGTATGIGIGIESDTETARETDERGATGSTRDSCDLH